MTCCSARTRRRTQRGQGLLLLMLVMLVAGASVLLAGLGSRASIRADDDEGTARALALAKEALIAYAVTDDTRPGELPCPDFNRDGVITPPQDYAGVNCRSWHGWLPWRTLDMEDVRDGAGQALWYAVSQNHFARSGAGPHPPINPDVAGSLTVDAAGTSDIVAVIIAPGEARGPQSRPADPPLGAPDASAHVAEYLEDGNADGDTAYVTSGGAEFNDRVVYITAQELMRAVEQRVLGEVAIALRDHRQNYGAYPWLSPFVAPASGSPAAFDGVPGTRVGHIAANDGGDIASHVQDTGFTIRWNRGGVPPVPVAELAVPLGPLGPLLEPFLQPALDLVFAIMGAEADADLDAGSYTFPIPQAPTGGDPSSCTWHGADIADCQGTSPEEPAGYPISVTVGLLSLTATSVQRQYIFDVSFTGTSAPAALDGARVRNVASAAPFQNHPPASVSTITVRHDAVLSLLGTPIVLATVTRRLDIADGSAASVAVDGIYFEPVEGGGAVVGDLRVPDWFYANQWHHFVLVKYADASDVLPAPGKSAPPPAVPCTPGPDCVKLDIVHPAGTATRVNAGAIVIGAGRQLAGTDRSSATATADQFFEPVLNADVAPNPSPAEAERRVLSSLFNDQVRVVEPLPPPPPTPPVLP